MISQITPAGLSPARRARSTAASVCPVRSQHAAGLGLQREHVPGLHEVARRALGVDGHLDRVRAVGGRDARRDALAGLDRDRERRLEGRLVLGRHQVEAQLVAALGRERQADQPAPLLGHEVDRVGRRELGGHGEVALVLAVLVVADDDHAARRGCPRSPPRRWRTASACACLLIAGHQLLDVLGQDVHLQVDRRAGRRGAEVGALERLGDQRDVERVVARPRRRSARRRRRRSSPSRRRSAAAPARPRS